MKTEKRPERSVLTLELSTLYSGRSVLAVVTLAGREGTLSRTWDGSATGGISVSQLEDIKGWALTTLENHFLTVLGAQEQLPL